MIYHNNFTKIKNKTHITKKDINKLINIVLKYFNKDIDIINLIFLNDEELLEINKKHLNHNYYTDVITFDLSINTNNIISDIYMSYERIEDNAKTYNVDFTKELCRVIIHSCLHLCGYKDKTPAQKKQMRQKENEFLKMI